MKMIKSHLNDKRGYSLVEVLVSIVLVALLASFVAIFMAYWQIVRTQSNDMTKSLNRVQQLIEQDYSDIKNHIQSNDTAWLDANANIVKSTISLFSRDITVYTVSEKVLDAKGKTVIELSRGIANTYRTTPTIPQISSVTITANGNSVDAVYFAGSTSYAAVKEPITLSESENFEKYLYQWYATGTNFHTVPLGGEEVNSEGKIIPGCPIDFNPLSGEQNNNLTGLSNYKGSMVACIVIPGSRQGYMGNSVSSNYIYVSALPALTTGKYFALYDASLIGAKDGYLFSSVTDDKLAISTVKSEIPNNSGTYINLTPTGTGSFKINTAGDNTSNGDSGNEYRSRYFIYDPSVSTTTDAASLSGTAYVFAVVHNVNVNNTIATGYYFKAGSSDILEMGIFPDKEGSFATNWQIQSGSVSLSSTTKTQFVIGNMNVNIAEFLIVMNPDANDITAINTYLSKKYNIS